MSLTLPPTKTSTTCAKRAVSSSVGAVFGAGSSATGAAAAAAAATAARARGLSLLTLGCVAGGTQQDFYEALGYTAVGTIPNFSLSPTGRPQGMTTLYQQLS